VSAIEDRALVARSVRVVQDERADSLTLRRVASAADDGVQFLEALGNGDLLYHLRIIRPQNPVGILSELDDTAQQSVA